MTNKRKREIEDVVYEVERLIKSIQAHNKYSAYPVMWRMDDLAELTEMCKYYEEQKVKKAAEDLLWQIQEVKSYRKTKKALDKPTQALITALQQYSESL